MEWKPFLSSGLKSSPTLKFEVAKGQIRAGQQYILQGLLSDSSKSSSSARATLPGSEL